MKISHKGALLALTLVSMAGIAISSGLSLVAGFLCLLALVVLFMPMEPATDPFKEVNEVTRAVAKLEGGKVNMNAAEINDVLKAYRQYARTKSVDWNQRYINIG